MKASDKNVKLMYLVICQGIIKGWYVHIVFMETPSFHICAIVVDAMDGTTRTCMIYHIR